jgi:molecular chaperone IbpA
LLEKRRNIMTRVTTLDLAPLTRHSVGFDRLFEQMDRQWANSNSSVYPPYNIVQIDNDCYEIVVAVAGFGPDDVTVTVEQNVLTVEGARSTEADVKYLHKGIAARSFRRAFTLADHVEVESAHMDLGLLTLRLRRLLPEQLQPKRIAITLNK